MIDPELVIDGIHHCATDGKTCGDCPIIAYCDYGNLEPEIIKTMEKHQRVFERFIDFENQYNGYLLARRNKRFRPEVLAYTSNLEENLLNEINHLVWKDYQISGVHEFYEYFPKKRLITA